MGFVANFTDCLGLERPDKISIFTKLATEPKMQSIDNTMIKNIKKVICQEANLRLFKCVVPGLL
jgi:hypothetical protein